MILTPRHAIAARYTVAAIASLAARYAAPVPTANDVQPPVFLPLAITLLSMLLTLALSHSRSGVSAS